MSGFVGPFLGFTIGRTHSSELKIVRVSSGDRYEQNLLPDFKDRTVEVPGGNGSYYFGSQYTSRKFTINFAFDNLTEFEIRRITQILGFQDIQYLSFDEAPYKRYAVKCAQPPQLKYICFEGQNYVDVYKGEGILNLISYYPFGFSDEYDIDVDPNDETISGYSNGVPKPGWVIINSGDMPIDNLKIYFNGQDIIAWNSITLWHKTSGRDRNNQIIFEKGIQEAWDLYAKNSSSSMMFELDFKNKLLQRVKSTYNSETKEFEYKPLEIWNGILTGDSKFFEIPVSGSYGFCFYENDGASRYMPGHGFKYKYRLLYF